MRMNRTNWKYIARFMRAKGYTVEAIEGTIANLGNTVSLRSIYRAIEGITPSTIEFNESLTKPLSMHAILLQVLEYEDESSTDCQKEDENPYIVGDCFSDDSLHAALDPPVSRLRPARGDADDFYSTPGFTVYSPSGRRTGVQSYLHRCSEQDREMRKTPSW